MDISKKALLSLVTVAMVSASQAAFDLEEMPKPQDIKKEEKIEQENADEKKVKALLTLLSTGAVCTFLKYTGESRPVQAFAGLFGLSSDELNFVTGLTGSLYALENLGVEGAGELAGRVPMATVTLKVVNSDTFQKIVKNIPVVGEKIGCTSDQRRGHAGNDQLRQAGLGHMVIDEAQFTLRRGLQFIGLYKVVEKTLPSFIKKASVNVAKIMQLIRGH